MIFTAAHTFTTMTPLSNFNAITLFAAWRFLILVYDLHLVADAKTSNSIEVNWKKVKMHSRK